jgi:integrase/recombinase XerD
MTALRQRMIEDMRLRNFSPHTLAAYTQAVAAFARYFKQSPEKLTGEHAREYLLHMIQERKASISSYNIARCALRFLYQITLGRDEHFERLPYARERRRLPVVLSQDELQRFFAVIRNAKHKTMCMIAYGAGLRASEVVSLRVDDIDSSRMLIRVRNGKGQKDRYAKLSPHLLSVLRDYYRKYKPKELLFRSRTGKPMTGLDFSRVTAGHCRRSGFSKRVTPHTFRHSYATHMLDAGADLRTIQVLLGHRNIKTTTIYMHVSQAKIDMAPSPLDQMYQRSPVTPTASAEALPSA